jgi:DNA repair protein RadA/Sms
VNASPDRPKQEGATARDALLEVGLPHSPDSERAILGAVLLDNEIIKQVATRLQVDDFYLSNHRIILGSMLSLHSQGMAVDAVTLKADLEAQRVFEQVGGVTYIASLMDGVPRTDTIEPYARILQGHSRMRRFIIATNQAMSKAIDGEEHLDSIVADLESGLLQLKPEGPRTCQIVRRCVADVQPEYVSFLWYPYIPLGKLTLIEGDPGVGKSWLACALASATAAGRGPNGWAHCEPGESLLLSVEDGLADTVRPRLDSMQAQVERIHALEGPLTLNTLGLLTLEKHIIDVKPLLVVIDPLVAYVGARVDLHRANEVRAVTAALALVAEKQRCAIVAIRHLTKGGKDRAIYRGIGSIDFTASARSVLLVGCDPDDPLKRAVAHIKSNLTEKGISQGYEIRGERFYWTGESDLTSERILGTPAAEGDRSALADAEDFLRAALADGALPSLEVQRHARKAGISSSTLRRARLTLGIKGKPNVFFRTAQPGKEPGQWFWQLPSEDAQPYTEEAQRARDEHLREKGQGKRACNSELPEEAHDSLFEHLPWGENQSRDEFEVIEV